MCPVSPGSIDIEIPVLEIDFGPPTAETKSSTIARPGAFLGPQLFGPPRRSLSSYHGSCGSRFQRLGMDLP